MWRNYVSAALRNLARNRLYTTINVVGLAIGFAVAIFVGLFVREELTYDRFISRYQDVYRVSMTRLTPGAPPASYSMAYYKVADWLKIDFPEIQDVARLWNLEGSLRNGDVELRQPIGFADPGFFRVFPLKTVAGHLESALNAPDSIVLTRQAARKYFGEDMPIGRTLELDRRSALRVTAVIEDLPANTHLNFTAIASSASVLQELTKLPEFNVRSFESHTYFRTVPGASIERIEHELPTLVDRHQKFPPGIELVSNLTRLADIHLHTTAQFPLKPAGDRKTLYAVALVGVLVVLIAVINFVNLMTARAAQRAIEVGVRKVSGARRRDLIIQFIGESLIYVALSMVVAIAIVELLMPQFNALLDRSFGAYAAPAIAFEYWRDGALAASLLGAALVIGVAAGFYPALVLSAFRPAAVLKGGVARTVGSFSVRQALVVIQFGILIVLILATAVIHRQTQFALNEGLRIDRNLVLLVYCSDPAIRRTFQDALTAAPGVRAVTSSNTAPTNLGTTQLRAQLPGGLETALQFTAVDYDFYQFYGLQPLAGRFFSRDRGTDAVQEDADPGTTRDRVTQLSLIVNETAVRALGLEDAQAAIGQTLHIKEWSADLRYEIVGVVPDFPVDSVRVPIQPTVYFVDQQRLTMISARLTGETIPETLIQIDRLWQRLGESRPIARQFLDEYYEFLYSAVRQQGKLFSGFASVALVIACLGLFGLSVLSAQQRTKEVGIRKAMGAGSGDVITLLLWQFMKPVLLAAVIALPLGAWAMNRWLEGFAHRVTLDPWLLIASAVVATVIGAMTVAGQVYSVARQHPSVALRYE